MITRQDLEEAIAECQGQRDPNANTCIKLAAFYTIRDAMFGEKVVQLSSTQDYSRSPAPMESNETLERYGDSEFLEVVEGKCPEDVMLVMDELMETMQVLQPRIYDSVLRKIMNL